MDNSTLLSLIVISIVVSLGLLALGILVFIVTAPSQYNPYRPELIEEDVSSATRELNKPEDGYASFNKHRDTNKKLRPDTSVQIVVLGDIGRSPRMQYHAISLAKHGARVDIVGFTDSEIHPDLKSTPFVNVVPLAPPPLILQTQNKLAFALLAPIKVIWQSVNLFYTLGYKVKPAKWMLVQNPPSIPVLAIAVLLCSVRNTKLIVDWHNFGWSVLALKLGKSHPLVQLSRIYEAFFSRMAEAHFAVTEAMSASLAKSNRIKALPLHDRPVSIFKPLTPDQRFDFLTKLEQTAAHAEDIKSGKWRLLVSSTSWTADEDFSMLLDALVGYSANAATDKSLPYVLAIITGKGPQKEQYLRKIQQLSQANKISRTTILTAWLSTGDYARLLGAADLGVSLHKSTSGVDLPMKVVDMFGAGLPVVGYSGYESWPELVKEGVNGRGFTTADQLQNLLAQLFGKEGMQLKRIREGATKEGSRRWDDEWDEVAGKQVFRVAGLQTSDTQSSMKPLFPRRTVDSSS